MKRTKFKIIALALVPCLLGASIAAVAVTAKSGEQKKILKKPLYKEGEVLVKYKKSASFSQKNNSIQRLGATKVSEFGTTGFMHIKAANGQSTNTMISQFKTDSDVESVQPNYIYHALAKTPNDTKFDQQWGLKNTGQTVSPVSYSTNNPGTSGKDMDLEKAWDQTTGSSSVIVAVVDTGVNYNHEDLAANMWDGGASFPHHGYDCVGDNDNDPMDLNGHGTHVAGTIGAVGNNEKGTTGICWNVRIMAVRVLDATGSGSTADIVEGVNWAVAHGAKVINMSLGGSQYDAAFYSSLTNARSKDVAVIVAAGNDGSSIDGTYSTSTPYADSYPCEYGLDNIVCVGAVDQSYSLADFSNYSPTKVQIAAPGTNIISTWNGTWTDLALDDYAGWTTGSYWASTVKSIPKHDGSGSYSLPLLVNPPAWDGSTLYRNGADDVAQKYYNLASLSPDAVKLNLLMYLDIESTYDFFGIWLNPGNSNPLSGKVVDVESGSTRQYTGTQVYFEDFYYMEIDLPKSTGQFTLGYEFTSDVSGQKTGTAMAMYFSYLKLAANKYNTIDGTSMATPHVAGLAALIKSFNPNYSYSDIIAAIKGGADVDSALNGKVEGGRVADAYGSIKFIQPPTGVTAVLQ